MRKKLIMAAAAAAIAVAAAPQAAIADPINAESKSTLDPELMQSTLEDIYGDMRVGAIQAEVRHGGKVWTSSLGDRDPDSGVAAKPTDRVRVASITKSTVVTSLLQLAEEQDLDLDAPIQEYLPDDLPYEEPISVRQILNHTSGLRDHFSYLYPNGTAQDFLEGHDDEYSTDELIELATGEPLLFEPGSDYSYSNTGYLLIGNLIEKVSGHRIQDVLSERIFGPVGMRATYFGTGSGIKGPHARGYVATDEAEHPNVDTTGLSQTQFWAAGAVVSNPKDVNKFYRALFDGTLLSPAQLKEMREITDASDPSTGGYGLGLVRFPLAEGCDLVPDGYAWGHTGGGIGYRTFSFHSPDGKLQATFTATYDELLTSEFPVYLALDAAMSTALCGSSYGPSVSDGGKQPEAPSIGHA